MLLDCRLTLTCPSDRSFISLFERGEPVLELIHPRRKGSDPFGARSSSAYPTKGDDDRSGTKQNRDEERYQPNENVFQTVQDNEELVRRHASG